MNIRWNHVLLLMICVPYSLWAAIVIQGNVTGSTSFNFPVESHARSFNGTAFYVGALNQGTAGNYALSGNFSGLTIFEPFAPETATINGVKAQANPLFNAAITQLATFETQVGLNQTIYFPIAVVQATPADLFLIREKHCDNITMLAAPNIKDVNGATTTGIIGLNAYRTEAIFAAVLPSASAQFGDPGSGIAVVQVTNVTVGEVTQTVLVQINADPNTALPETTPAASPLDRTSASLKINTDLVSIDNVIDMHYSARLNRLYVALKVQGAAGATDGARAIAVGQLNPKLSFVQIAPDTVFIDADEIVGGVGANAEISIHKVRTMHTSTKLDYLVVVGGNGAPANTQRSVYAVPLVNTIPIGTINDAIQGTLANVNVDPVDIFSPAATNSCQNNPELFKARVFPQAATAPDEIYHSASVQAFVGGGLLPYGDITDINVSYDVIFVSVANPINNELPGIFYSQALFDNQGVIIAWTPWQRVAGTTDPVYAISYEPTLADFLWLTGSSAVTINTAKRTLWGTGATDGLADLVTVMSQLMPETTAGIQGFFNVPPNTPGLFDISMFIATGLKQVVLVESGEVVAGVLIPNTGDFQTDLQQFTDGTITANFPIGVVRVVSITGGVLDDLCAIIAAALGVNGTTNQGYLFVGGAGGLAVLAQADGSGWSTASGLGYQFNGLVDGMRFIKLGDYAFVRKLIYDQGFLYVLTDTKLDRIDIAASDFATGSLSVTTVATLHDVQATNCGTLLDLLVSGKCALIGASTGLFRVGNDSDIQTAVTSADVNWTQVEIPEGISVVQYMQALSASSAPNSFAQGVGNVYIDDAYRGFDVAQVNRYTVADVSTDPITDDTIVPLPDVFVKDILTDFKPFGNFRNSISYDGAALFSTRDRTEVNPPILFNWNTPLPLEIACSSFISAVVLSSATGSRLVAGDFGLRVNE